MAKARASFVVAALCSVSLGTGCGQESDGSSFGTGGGTGHDRSSSLSGSAGDSGSGGGGRAAGGQSASSGRVGGQPGDTGGSSTASSSLGDGSGGSSTASSRGGSSAASSRGGDNSGGTGATSSKGGTGATSSSAERDAGAGSGGSTATRPDAGTSSPKDAGAPSGDAAVIPDLPTRQDAAAAFWAAAFTSNCKPPAIGGRAQDDGHHKPGTNCMTSGCHLNPKKAEHRAGTDCRGSGCHSNGSPDGSGAPAFLFGGTAYRAATLVPEVAAEIGVRTANGFYTACSASNGNFWVLATSGTTSLTWTGATTRVRNANGEAPMMTPPAAGCNATTCHTGTLKITAP